MIHADLHSTVHYLSEGLYRPNTINSTIVCDNSQMNKSEPKLVKASHLPIVQRQILQKVEFLLTDLPPLLGTHRHTQNRNLLPNYLPIVVDPGKVDLNM